MSIKKNIYSEVDSSREIIVGIKSKILSKKEVEEAVILAKKDDEDAYLMLLGHIHNYLIKLCKEFFIQGSEQKDIYQEGAIKLINVIKKYDKKKGDFTYFAQSSIRKHIITSVTKEQAKKRSVLNNCHSLNEPIINKDGETVCLLDTLEEPANKESLVYEVIQKNHEEFIIEEISKVLSPMEHKIFVLRFIESLSYKEIAKKLNLKKLNNKGEEIFDHKSVDNAIWRSRPKIKKVLERLNLNTKII